MPVAVSSRMRLFERAINETRKTWVRLSDTSNDPLLEYVTMLATWRNEVAVSRSAAKASWAKAEEALRAGDEVEASRCMSASRDATRNVFKFEAAIERLLELQARHQAAIKRGDALGVRHEATVAGRLRRFFMSDVETLKLRVAEATADALRAEKQAARYGADAVRWQGFVDRWSSTAAAAALVDDCRRQAEKARTAMVDAQDDARTKRRLVDEEMRRVTDLVARS